MEQESEIPLAGGNLTKVVRVGDTVRREAGSWTPIHSSRNVQIHVRTFQALTASKNILSVTKFDHGTNRSYALRSVLFVLPLWAR
jgi:hypothetical protein